MMQGRGVWASLGMLLFVLGLWGCPDLGPTCPAPSVLLGGQCYPQCVEGDVNYCARDGSVLFPPDVVEDVRRVVDAGDAGEAGFADRESMDVPVDVAPMCPANTPTRCADVCVDTTASLEHCGRCAMMCPSTANGTATCTMGRCGISCAMGYQSLGGVCIADRLVPRQIAPLSLGDVTLRRPTLRWELPAGFDGALVEICRDRACAQVIETINVVGTSTRPLMPLPATTVVFWRLRGRVGAATSATNSPVWLFHVPLRDGTSGVDTSYHAHNDVNGDGFDDVVVGAPRASPGGRSGAGRVSVYHGGLMGLSAMPARELEGVLADDSFGSSVAAAGDLNGDGYGDVVVGANGEDSPRAPPGSVSVFHGSALGLGAMAARVLVGVGPRDHFGDALAGAGDLNGDGYADLVVGAPNADPMGRSNAGTASVFSGSAMGVGANASRVIEGLNADDAFGYSVASAGDLNGDGLGDVLVGAYLADPEGRMGAGRVSIFAGNVVGIAALPSLTLDGEISADLFGSSVALAGDVNGDGLSDLAIGAFGASPGGINRAGTVSIFIGRLRNISVMRATQLTDAVPDERFGELVAGAGDLNADGFSDVAVGLPMASPMGRVQAGSVKVFHGNQLGITVAPVRTLNGVDERGYFGFSVSSGADIDGDGFSELVVGGPSTSPMGILNVGSVSIFQGGVGGLGANPSQVLGGPEGREGFGLAIAMLLHHSISSGKRTGFLCPS